MTARRRNGAGAHDAVPDATALAERFVDVARSLQRGTRRATMGGLSLARYDVLHTVFHHDKPSMGEVAARLGVAARTVTDLVDGLEQDGLLRREPDRSDRRRTNLALTDAGRDALREAHRARLAGAAAPFDVLASDERAALARLLDRLAAGTPPSPG